MSLISKKWIGGIVFLAILAALCVGMMGWKTQSMIASAYESCGAPNAINLKELGLSPQQVSKIKGLQAAYRKKIVGLCQQHCDEKMKFAKLLEADRVDGSAVRASTAEIARIERESEQMTTEHMLAMAQVMDEKQSKIFLRKFSTEIVKTCPIVFAPEAK